MFRDNIEVGCSDKKRTVQRMLFSKIEWYFPGTFENSLYQPSLAENGVKPALHVRIYTKYTCLQNIFFCVVRETFYTMEVYQNIIALFSF